VEVASTHLHEDTDEIVRTAIPHRLQIGKSCVTGESIEAQVNGYPHKVNRPCSSQ
jgi:hypothetical protein